MDLPGHLRECAKEESDHLHAAQLAARKHVVPHIIAAAGAARAAGDEVTFECYMALAVAVNGDFDPKILQYGAAFLRFVAGGK